VLKTKQKDKVHKEIITEHRVYQLTQAHERLSGKKEDQLTPLEKDILRRLCGTGTLNSITEQGYSELVGSVDRVVQDAESLQATLSDTNLTLDATERTTMINDLTTARNAVRRNRQHSLARSIHVLDTLTERFTHALNKATAQSASAYSTAETIYTASAAASSRPEEPRIEITAESVLPDQDSQTIIADLRDQLRKNEALTARLQTEAWWLSSDFTPNEQELMRTFRRFCKFLCRT